MFGSLVAPQLCLCVQKGEESHWEVLVLDNHHHPSLTAILSEAALLENDIVTVLMLLPTDIIWVFFRYEGIYGSLLFDITLKIYFQA